jgi:hypothetical protein
LGHRRPGEVRLLPFPLTITLTRLQHWLPFGEQICCSSILS